jgi:hypothetical protein
MSISLDLFTADLTTDRLQLELQTVQTEFVLAREEFNFVDILPHWTLTPRTGESVIIIGHRSLAFTLQDLSLAMEVALMGYDDLILMMMHDAHTARSMSASHSSKQLHVAVTRKQVVFVVSS